MKSLKINYKNNSSELCKIGAIYDTDKSSQRNNVSNERHCHPYTLFYDGLFKNFKNDKLKIAEIGKEGGSLLMWKEYFVNSEIYGFEYNNGYINEFKKNFNNNFNNDRITLSKIDVYNKESIVKSFSELNILYDIIIEDTTHQFEDQIRVIENIYKYLKPGGILIIEDIFKSYDENNYINRLTPILNNFQDYYFIELDHVNKNSTGWNNDKLFVLVKGGDKSRYIVQGMVPSLDNKKLYFYTFDEPDFKNSYISCYSYPMHRMNKIYCKDEGFIKTKLINLLNSSMTINLETNENGYIIIEIYDQSNNLILKSNKLIGNEFNLLVNWEGESIIEKNNYYAKFIINNSNLYSFTYNYY